MAVTITPRDLFLSNVDDDRAMQTIATVIARASLFAPCILLPATPTIEAAMKGILVDIVVRRYRAHELPLGLSRSRAEGGRSESLDTKDVPTALFYPGEITELQALCAAATETIAAATAPVYSFPDPQPWPDGLSC